MHYTDADQKGGILNWESLTDNSTTTSDNIELTQGTKLALNKFNRFFNS